MDEDSQRRHHIVIVGPCAAGKSTLVRGLWSCGFEGARIAAQEHSGVPDLWRRRGRPDVLIYLDARLETIAARQHRHDWTVTYLAEQADRLRMARVECDLYLETDDLTIEQILDQAVAYLLRGA